MRISRIYDALGRVSKSIPGDSLHLRKAVIVVHPDTGELAVNLDGNIVDCSWADHVHVFAGDTVLAAVIRGARGQAEAVIMARLAGERERPVGGTVFSVPGGATPTIVVTGSDGYFYNAYYAMSYTPVVGDPVYMAWGGGRPCVVGKLKGAFTRDPTTNTDPTPVDSPPDDDVEGEAIFAAEASGTWSTTDGAWDAYRFGANHVYQSATQNGAWFYHGGPDLLNDGRTIDGVEFTLGQRLAVGAYNEPVVVHFYLHTSQTKPASTDVTRTAGAYDVLIPGGTTSNTVELPVEWGPDLVAGGGISISGDNLAGFKSSTEDSSSGLLALGWTTEE